MVCRVINTTDVAQSSASSFRYKIQGELNCDTRNVVYLLECTVCRVQYIGQTETSFRVRFNNHRAHVKSLPQLPISQHANIIGHQFDKFRVTILRSGFQTHYDREACESYLIHKFNTMSGGLNETIGKLTFFKEKQIIYIYIYI